MYKVQYPEDDPNFQNLEEFQEDKEEEEEEECNFFLK